MTEKKQRYRATDIEDAQRLYEQTGDPMFLALAIGMKPHEPPLWALEECVALTETVGGLTTGGTDQERMGRRLDEMWRFFFAETPKPSRDVTGRAVRNRGPSLAAAARHALEVVDKLRPGDPAFEAGNINVQRAWRAERQDVAPTFEDYELFDGLVSTPRMVRIMLEWGDGEAGFPFRHVSLHLARRQRERD